MPQLAFANTFWENYDRLEKQVRAGVRKAMSKFQQLSIAELYADKGLHLESVDNARDARMRTIRITDFWRGVVLAPDDGSDIFLLLNVVRHDDAYSWAAKRLYTVNTATRGLEVRNVVAIEQLTPSLEKAASTTSELLFAALSDSALRHLGIDDQVLRATRAITDKAQLDAFGGVLPEDQFEVLQFLAEGFSAEEVYRDVVSERQAVALAPDHAENTLARAVVNTASRFTLVSGPDELDDILSKPFAAWRVFLHPSQRRIAYRPSYSGPAQVTGGPGTGKTVVAMHRVKHLLGRTPESRVLLTTFTNALARSLSDNLALLVDDEDLLARVHITTVDSFAHRVVRDLAVGARAPISDTDERAIWRRIRHALQLPWTEQFLAQEFRHVVLAQKVASKEEYLRVERRGRGSALRWQQREQLWQAVEAFRHDLRASHRTTHLQVCARAAVLLGHSVRGSHHFDHVVVDEAQDLHPAQWRVLRAAVAEGPDDLFVTGDPHQRIYNSRVSLRALGISVAGRSSRLRINYRSTAEILAWSTGVIDDSPVEDLGGDGHDSLLGYRSLLRGRQPDVQGYRTQQDEIAAVVARVREWIDQGVPASEIAVCTRFNVLLDKMHDALRGARLPVVRVRDRQALTMTASGCPRCTP